MIYRRENGSWSIRWPAGRFSPKCKYAVLLGALVGMISCPGSVLAAGPSSRQSVLFVQQLSNGIVFVGSSTESWGNPDACTHSHVLVIDADSEVRRELFAMVLSAQLQEREIRANLVGCITLGVRSYPRAASVILY